MLPHDPDEVEFELEADASSQSSPGLMMKILRDASSWPRWQPEITETQGPQEVSPGDTVLGRARMLGFGVHGHSTTLRLGEGYLEEDVLVGVRMRVRYEVRPAASGTDVRHRMHLYPLTGPAGRLLSVVLRWRLRRMQRDALRNLSAQAGEPAA